MVIISYQTQIAMSPHMYSHIKCHRSVVASSTISLAKIKVDGRLLCLHISCGMRHFIM